MSYQYEEHREWINGPEGTKALASVLKHIEQLLEPAGAAMMCKLWPVGIGNTDRMMAAVDRAVELGVIVEVNVTPRPWGQHRIFTLPEERT